MDSQTPSGSRPEATAELMLAVAQCFFSIRALGQQQGLITNWGGGSFGFMRSLALLGPLTVPQIARMRPTSRQRMQRLADELAEQGWLEFNPNPAHRRSQLMQLTPEGRVHYEQLNEQLLAVASSLGSDLSEADISSTTAIVRHLGLKAKAFSQSSSDP